MRIILLEKLKPGDVILESGDEKIGQATDGVFGHASLVLGRLIKIEAGLHDGVVCSPFECKAFRRGEQLLIGQPLDDGDAIVVMRRKQAIASHEIKARALLEAGRRYSPAKAFDLTDLTKQARVVLEARLRGSRRIPDREGRICSEVVAEVLQLPETIVSPNALASSTELQEVKDIILDVGDWSELPVRLDTDLVTKVAAIETGLARRAMKAAQDATEPVRRGEVPVAAAAAVLEEILDRDLRRSLKLLMEIEDLEAGIPGWVPTSARSPNNDDDTMPGATS